MKFKKAFNLTEVMMFVMITGLITTIGLIINKPQDTIAGKNIKYRYSAVYDALNLSLYDLVNKNLGLQNPFVLTEEEIASGKTNYKKLCEGLASYINTSESHCNIAPFADTYLQNADYNFYNQTPQLSTQNGMNFYITNLIVDDKSPKTSRSYYKASNPNFDLTFFMIYVDLNATIHPGKPHTINYNGNKKTPPDVHAFAVLPNGDAIPIGIAEDNIEYFTTKVNFARDGGLEYSKALSLRSAKHYAWDWYRNNTNPSEFIKTARFTYNDYIKEILLRKGSKIYDYLNSGDFPTTFDSAQITECIPTTAIPIRPYDRCGITAITPKFRTLR